MKKLLIIYDPRATVVATTKQFSDAFRIYSRYQAEYLSIDRAPKEPIDFSRYDAVYVNYCARIALEGYVPEPIKQSLIDYSGPKLIAVQDEYEATLALRAALKRIGFDVVLTCVPPQSVGYVYPPETFPHSRFETVLTGYVGDELVNAANVRPLAERPITVGYRGRILPFSFGDLGWQKSEIGRRVRGACLRRGISCDIAVDEGSRIYGNDWFDFIKNCRVTLGSESGSNIFDFDGSLRKRCDEILRADPGLSYEQFQSLIGVRENEIDMAQISPRVFEAAALRSALVLIRGRYSGLLEPEIHYIPLDPDYGNLDAVLDRLDDVAALQAMADRTHDDIVASGRYSYRNFVARVDELIEEASASKPVRLFPAGFHPPGQGFFSSEPLGGDPYLLEKLRELREAVESREQGLKEAYLSGDRAAEQAKRLTREVERLGQQRNRLADENAAIKEEMARLRAIAEQLTEQNAQLEKAKADLEDTATAAHRKGDRLTAQIARLGEERNQLADAKDALTEEIAQLHAAKEQLTEQNAQLLQAKADLERVAAAAHQATDRLTVEIARVGAERNRLADANAALETVLALARAANEQLAQHNAQLINTRTDLERVATEAHKSTDRLTAEIARVGAERNRLADANAGLEGELALARAAITQLAEQNAELATVKGDLEHNAVDAYRSGDRLATELDRIGAERNRLADQNAALLKELALVRDANEQLAGQNTQLIAQKDRRAAIVAQNAGLMNELALLRAANDQLARQNAQLGVQKDEQEAIAVRNAMLVNELASLRAANEQLARQHAQLSVQKDEQEAIAVQAYHQTDILIAKLEQIGQERNRLADENAAIKANVATSK